MIMRDTKEGANTETGVLYSSNSEGNKFAISQEDINLIDDDIADVFIKLNVEVVIDDCNFNKALGIDWFSGKVLKINH